LTEIKTGLGWKARRYTKASGPQNKAEVAMLISDK
jgi:hypothetical protein